MTTVKGRDLFVVDSGITRDSENYNSMPPSWVFQHKNHFLLLEPSQKIDQKKLINILNHLHFTEQHILVHFFYSKYGESILLKARPNPCSGDEMTCHWLEEDLSLLNFEDCRFQKLIIPNGQSVILVPAIVCSIDKKSFSVRLPSICYSREQRKIKRFPCDGIQAKISQSGFSAQGTLLDYSAAAFRIRIEGKNTSLLHWFNHEAPYTVSLWDEHQLLFTESCKSLRHESSPEKKDFVFYPVGKSIQRSRKRNIRSPRYILQPSPTITFQHPFLKKTVKRDICDISNTGFSVIEKINEALLIPGMIIPNLTISYAGSLELSCKAQVIYVNEKADHVHCGLAILDIDIAMYNKLTQLLSNIIDRCTYINNTNIDSLWQFLFETGFIYPEKYQIIEPHRSKFKDTYQKLYQKNQNIAVHFTYEESGNIYAHISMIKTYEKAWLVHHFAAKPMDGKLTGFLVLKQLIQYLDGLYRLPSAKMDYVMAYFQPHHKIANSLFGGFCRYLQDFQGCSLDQFSYILFQKKSLPQYLPEEWRLQKFSDHDLWHLNLFYKNYSGGLLINALGLGNDIHETAALEETYHNLGFHRKKIAMSLRYNDIPVAVFVINQSDIGLNLSELINSIKVIVIDQDRLGRDILDAAISLAGKTYTFDKVPVMLYPHEYADKNSLPVEKHYQCWVLNLVNYEEEYLKYIERKFRIKLS